MRSASSRAVISRSSLIALCVGALGFGCSSTPPPPELGTTQSAILNGKPSGDEDNAVVYIETIGADIDSKLRCTGRIIAPGLVITARHCLLKRKSANVRCNIDGSPIDISDTTDVRPEPPEQVTVFVGAHKPNLKPLAVREIITNLEVTICRSDVGFLVLKEPDGLNVRTPLRVDPVLHVGDEVSVAGWGYTSDTNRDSLPNDRSILDHLRISDVGPGTIPAGAFAIGGNSVCLGDSGASAMINGAVAGTYSRITTDVTACSLEQAQNIFAGLWLERTLMTTAYAAIGEEPWFDGERPPFLTAAGGACAVGDECRSGRCDAQKCAEPCGGVTKAACPADQACLDAIAGTCGAAPIAMNDAGASAPTDEEGRDSSCALTKQSAKARETNVPASLLFLLFLIASLRRVRVRARY